MALQICCSCGYTFRGEDEDEMWEKGFAHVQEQHPEMAAVMTREDLLAQAELV